MSTVGVLPWPSLEAQQAVYQRAQRRECTCTQTVAQDPETPGEWEQNPMCPSHPDPMVLIAAIEQLATVKAAAPAHLAARVAPAARAADPDTSHAAAASVDPFTARQLHLRIVKLLLGEALTHEQIAQQYDDHVKAQGWPPVSPSGLRSRTAELHRAGLVVDTGRRAPMSTGRQAIVWALDELVEGRLPLWPSWEDVARVVAGRAREVAA